MKTLGKFIAERTPKFNKIMVEGFCYHRINRAIDYIDNFIRYSVESKTNTHLRYLGYREVTPREEIKMIFDKSSKIIYDIARNDIYLVEFAFQYGNEPNPRIHYFYIPYLNRGNTMYMSGNKFLIMPTLADKVVSVGDKIIFINILTAKYSFTKSYFAVKVNDKPARVSIVETELYKNQPKKQEDTTKAKPTVIHYLLANFGYTATMRMLLGFVPEAVYDYNKEDKVIISTTGEIPNGYIKDKSGYVPTRIKFLVDRDKYNEEVLYCVGNIYYILDNFPDRITIDDLDNTFLWKLLLSEIIHSGNNSIGHLTEKIQAHFTDLNSKFHLIVIEKLKDVGIEANNLIELMTVIFKNFNNWLMKYETPLLYHKKTFEAESFILNHITANITRLMLELSKEELRIGGNMLDSKVVDKIFKANLGTKMKAIFNLKKDIEFVTSLEYCGDHLYYKNTAMVNQQESNYVNYKDPNSVNTSARKKIIGSMASIGSILGLSKKNPNPLLRLNPYVNVDFETGTVLPPEGLEDIVERTDKLLSNMIMTDSVEDNDGIDEDIFEVDSEEEENEFDNEFYEQLDVDNE